MMQNLKLADHSEWDLTVKDVAAYLHIKPNTLYKWIYKWGQSKTGTEPPKFKHFGRMVRFRPKDVQEWEAAQTGHKSDNKKDNENRKREQATFGTLAERQNRVLQRLLQYSVIKPITDDEREDDQKDRPAPNLEDRKRPLRREEIE